MLQQDGMQREPGNSSSEARALSQANAVANTQQNMKYVMGWRAFVTVPSVHNKQQVLV